MNIERFEMKEMTTKMGGNENQDNDLLLAEASSATQCCSHH